MKRGRWLEGVVLVGAAFVALWGIGSFGLWEPWELTGRRASEALGFWLGRSEWSARIGAAISGVTLAALVYAILRWTDSRRAGIIGVAVLVSCPLFLLNARLSMGDAAGMAAQAWVGVTALGASDRHVARGRRFTLYALLATGVFASTWVSGALLGPLPPILAVGAWSLLSEGRAEGVVSRWLFPVASIALVAGVARAVFRDAPEPSLWLGGGAVGGNPPTWDAALSLVFHGFAPWSASLPLALALALWPGDARTERAQRVSSVLLLWLGWAFAAWTLFASRYGTPPWLAVLPLAALVALWLADAGSRDEARWPSAVVVALLTGLLVRDYALYPESPLSVLAADMVEVPSDVHAAKGWAIVLALAGLTVCMFLVSPSSTRRPNPTATNRWLIDQWQAPWPRRGWALIAASLLGACVVFGVMCLTLDLPIASMVVRGGKVALFVPLLLALLVFGLPWLQLAFSRLGASRVMVAAAGGMLAGAFCSLLFQPALSAHFSPKPVYESYNELRGNAAEPLAAYRTATGAASYYTDVDVQEVNERENLVDYLSSADQRWAIVPADALGALNERYRAQTGHHLYVADARSARLVLTAAHPVTGRPNQNFIASAILTDAPEPTHVVDARFGNRVALIGYDLELPEGDSVGAGVRFELTWYWRVLEETPSGHEVFVHIDGDGLRLNGDHAPAEGKYPPRLWKTGDVVADRQTLRVPPNFRPGDYVIYVGWFKGDKRIPVEVGSQDGVNRLRVGELRVR